MGTGNRNYILAETAISVVINMVLSGLFCWVVFHGRTTVVAAGPSGYLIDTVPQTLMITLMSMLVPGLLTRQRIRTGRIAPLPTPPRALPRRLLLRSALVAVASAALAAGVVLGLDKVVAVPNLSLSSLMAVKLFYGAVAAAVVTPFGLRAALSEVPAAA